jgi:hypothetical protein
MIAVLFLAEPLPLWRDPTTVSAVSTVVIAVATIVYVCFTIGLWRSTSRAARAAMISAEAAKQSAEMAASVHRPSMGLVKVYVKILDANQPRQLFAWTLKNFGTLPAVEVTATAQLLIGPHTWGSQGPASLEIFPHEEIESPISFQLSPELCRGVYSGDQCPVVRVHVNYAAADGRRYLYKAEAHYMHESGSFLVLSSQTVAA